ncbi:MAG TPA: hypothetical protein VD735_00490 [Candidatus Saccharimonadales bacterium]|nr:hypothetical protein [Candidatus Saccharimonadales bacterium]
MYFVSSSRAERTAAFDHFVGTTQYALEQLQPGYIDPRVLKYKVTLLGNLAHAFLPDFRHGVATLPTSKRDSSGVAVVPIKEGEKIQSDISLWYPTPRRIAETVRRYGMTEGQVIADGMRLINSGTPHQKPLQREPNAYMGVYSTYGEENGVTIYGRGVMNLPYDQRRPALISGAVGAHEMLHDEQFMERWSFARPGTAEGLLMSALTELPAYHLSAGILGHAGLAHYSGDRLVKSIVTAESIRGDSDMFNPPADVVARLARSGAL